MNTLLFALTSSVLMYGIAVIAEKGRSFSFVTSVSDPNKTSDCNHSLHTFLNVTKVHTSCKKLRLLRSTAANGNCSQYVFNNTRVPMTSLKRVSEKLTAQYCNGRGHFWPCFQCFNRATEPLWNSHPCPVYGAYSNLPACLRSYPNPNFNWSREVILKDKHVVRLVSPHAPPYNKCMQSFSLHFKFSPFNVSFPIHLPHYPEDRSREMTVMLSLLMNAFEDNNPAGTTVNQTKYPIGIKCWDLFESTYLITYRQYNPSPYIYEVPMTITNSFKTLRADMCDNAADCISCFTEGDTILSFFTRNYLKRSSHYGMDKVDMNNCSASSQKQYEIMLENPHLFDTSKMTTKAVPIINVVAFNAYSYLGYALRHSGTACSVTEDGEMLCFVYFTQLLMESLRTAETEAETDGDIMAFSYNCPSCDEFVTYWFMFRYTDYD